MIDVGVREGIWALVAVLAIYMAVILFRLAVPRKAEPADEDARSPQTVVVDAPARSSTESPAPPGVDAARPAVPLETLNELEIQQLRRDVAQLRTEQDFLRSELVAMRLDMNELQAVKERPQQYVRPVSPPHSEAMLLAGRGIAAAQIADHCGISVAEAELVCALARAEDGT
jgi:hypothetical protein